MLVTAASDADARYYRRNSMNLPHDFPISKTPCANSSRFGQACREEVHEDSQATDTLPHARLMSHLSTSVRWLSIPDGLCPECRKAVAQQQMCIVSKRTARTAPVSRTARDGTSAGDASTSTSYASRSNRNARRRRKPSPALNRWTTRSAFPQPPPARLNLAIAARQAARLFLRDRSSAMSTASEQGASGRGTCESGSPGSPAASVSAWLSARLCRRACSASAAFQRARCAAGLDGNPD